MAVHETKKQSDLEKRLRILRRSLSVTDTPGIKSVPVFSNTTSANSINLLKTTIASDVLFLKRDLTKILILSAAAFVVQGVIYFALGNKGF